MCTARPSNNKVVLCPHPDADFCLCVPDSNSGCVQNSDCRDEEYCGIDGGDGKRLCVGCQHLRYNRVRFRPVQPLPSQQRCAGPRPSCGRTMDFCSSTLPCADDLSCMANVLGKFFTCDRSNIACRCFTIDNKTDRTITLQSCASNSDCKHLSEGCVWDISTSQNYCVSCHAIQHMHHLRLNDTSKCTGMRENRPIPQFYRSSPNGLTFDTCRKNLHCMGTHTCRRYVNIKQPHLGFANCDNFESQCYCIPNNNTFQSCNTGIDCVRGESCVTSGKIQLSKICASNAVGEITGANSFQFVGQRTYNGDGQGLTQDICSVDWDCKKPRRCTHVSDTFGGCAGRSGCRCMPLGSSLCSLDSQCTPGEKCVKYVDSYEKPHCVSAVVVKKDESVISVSNTSAVALRPTPLPQGLSRGLTEDPCLSDDDCKGDRICLHKTEYAGLSCNMSRRGCVCRSIIKGEGSERTHTLICQESKDCEVGEICTVIEDALPAEPLCMSTLTFDRLRISGIGPPRIELGFRPTSLPSPTPSPSSFHSTPEEYVEAADTPEAYADEDDNDDEENEENQDNQDNENNDDNEENEGDTGDNEEIGTDTDDGSAESDNTDGVCVDVDLLLDLDKNGMVFRKHRRAAVLCDKDGSCATPGHMVVFQRRPMAMRTYCREFVRGGCEQRIKLVNSPRMKVRLRILSRTHGLSMTAMATKFGHRIEEVLLQGLIELGL